MVGDSHYDVLGIARCVEAASIRAAYRRLAKLHHPDVAKGLKDAAAERFRRIQEAYEVLSDARRRAKYDALLDAEAKASAQRAAEASADGEWSPSGTSFTSRPQTATVKGKHLPGYKRNHAAWLVLIILVGLDVLAMKAWPALTVPLAIVLLVLVFAIRWESIDIDFEPTPEPEFQWRRPPPTTQAEALQRKLGDACAYVGLGLIGLMLVMIGIISVATAIRIK
jgi:hypothetical protein